LRNYDKVFLLKFEDIVNFPLEILNLINSKIEINITVLKENEIHKMKNEVYSFLKRFDNQKRYKTSSIPNEKRKKELEHIKDYRRCIEELKRILKVDGVIHIKVPHFTCAGSNSEFHKTRFWYHSFTANRLRKSQRTSGEASGLYDDFEQIGKKKINFVKGFLFWNYLIEPLINLHPFVSVLYEHTFICYLFPASEIEVELKKLHEENIKNDKYDADAHANCYPGY